QDDDDLLEQIPEEVNAATGPVAVEGAEPWLPVFTIDEADWSDATPLSDAEPGSFTPATWERGDTQLLLFTSGTTGDAKAVTLTMGNLLASATASAFRLGIDPADRWLVPLSLHHMGGIAPVLRSTLYGTTVIVRESFDPGGTVDDLREYDATCISLVPTMLRRMLESRGTLPDSLRFVLVGGAPCPEELIERCRDYSVPICPTYGMTETASQVATARHEEAYDHPDTVGRPLLWTDVTVVDSAGSPVEPGESGELVVRGPTVTPGYYGDPAATGEAIGAHGLHTGDVGYRDEEGRLYVLNRLDDRILTGGENVDPGEVVEAIRTHPGIEDAAVVGLDDEEWGEQVAALLVPTEDGVDVDDLEAHLRERLAGFKLPRTIGTAEELPRTVSGTVERDAVRERLREDDTVSIGRDQPSARAASDAESVRAVAREASEDEPTELPESEEPSDGETDDSDRAADTEPALDREPAAAGESVTEDAGSARPPLGDDREGDGALDVTDAAEETRLGGAALSSPHDTVDAASDRLTGGAVGEPSGSDDEIETDDEGVTVDADTVNREPEEDGRDDEGGEVDDWDADGGDAPDGDAANEDAEDPASDGT
ncbi:AMP-binding protein, partial [Halolamina salina]